MKCVSVCPRVRGALELLLGCRRRGYIADENKVQSFLLHPVPPDRLHQTGACFSVSMALSWERTSDQADRFILTEKFCNLYDDQPLAGTSPDYWPVDFESPLGSHTELSFVF